MSRSGRALVDLIAFVVIAGGFALYYIPTHQGGQVGWERVIPLGLGGLYWVSREPLFRWLGRL